MKPLRETVPDPRVAALQAATLTSKRIRNLGILAIALVAVAVSIAATEIAWAITGRVAWAVCGFALGILAATAWGLVMTRLWCAVVDRLGADYRAHVVSSRPRS